MPEIADTIWRLQDGSGEYIGITPDDIVDPSGNYLVDPSGNQIVSTDTSLTTTPDTVWENDNPAS